MCIEDVHGGRPLVVPIEEANTEWTLTLWISEPGLMQARKIINLEKMKNRKNNKIEKYGRILDFYEMCRKIKIWQ